MKVTGLAPSVVVELVGEGIALSHAARLRRALDDPVGVTVRV